MFYRKPENSVKQLIILQLKKIEWQKQPKDKDVLEE